VAVNQQRKWPNVEYRTESNVPILCTQRSCLRKFRIDDRGVDIIHPASSSEDSLRAWIHPPKDVPAWTMRAHLPLFFTTLSRLRGIRRSFSGGVHRFACASEIAGAYVVRRAGPAAVYNRNRGFRENRRMKSDGTFYRAARPFPGTFRHIHEPSLLLSWPSLRVHVFISVRLYDRSEIGNARYADRRRIFVSRAHAHSRISMRQESRCSLLCAAGTRTNGDAYHVHFRAGNLCMLERRKASPKRERERRS